MSNSGFLVVIKEQALLNQRKDEFLRSLMSLMALGDTKPGKPGFKTDMANGGW
jgi:hypothetical protein